LQPFVRFERVLYGPDSDNPRAGSAALPLLRPDLTLISYSLLKGEGTVSVGSLLTTETLPQHWGRVKQYIRETRRADQLNFEPEYGQFQIQLWPESDRIVIRRSAIMLVKKVNDDALNVYRAKGAKIQILVPNKGNLCSAVSRAFRYPSFLFRRECDPVMRARLLEMTSRFRMKTWCGVLNSKTTFDNGDDYGDEEETNSGD